MSIAPSNLFGSTATVALGFPFSPVGTSVALTSYAWDSFRRAFGDFSGPERERAARAIAMVPAYSRVVGAMRNEAGRMRAAGEDTTEFVRARTECEAILFVLQNRLWTAANQMQRSGAITATDLAQLREAGMFGAVETADTLDAAMGKAAELRAAIDGSPVGMGFVVLIPLFLKFASGVLLLGIASALVLNQIEQLRARANQAVSIARGAYAPGVGVPIIDSTTGAVQDVRVVPSNPAGGVLPPILSNNTASASGVGIPTLLLLMGGGALAAWYFSLRKRRR